METRIESPPVPSVGFVQRPDFRKLWIGQTVSLFGSRVGGFALTFVAVVTLHATPIAVALLNAAQYAPGLIVGLFAGVWVDRLQRRPVMIVADLGRALVLAVIPAAAVFHHLSIALLFCVTLAVSILTVLFDVAYRAYLPSLVGREELVEGNSRLQASASITEFGGWSVAGLLMRLLTIPGTVVIDTVSFLVSAASLAAIGAPEPPPAPAAERQGTWREIGEGLSLLREQALVRTLATVVGTWYLFRNIIGAVIILFVTRELHVSPALQGVIYAIGGVSSFGGAVLTGRITRRFGIGPTMLGALLVAVAASICVPLAHGPLPLIVIWLVLPQVIGDGAATLYEIAQVSLLQARTPTRLLGRMNASIRFIEWGAILGGLLLGGVLGEVIGLRQALFVAAGGQLLAPLILALSPVRRLRAE